MKPCDYCHKLFNRNTVNQVYCCLRHKKMGGGKKARELDKRMREFKQKTKKYADYFKEAYPGQKLPTPPSYHNWM
ncbi:MAG: hypothetical protein KGJ90_04940 [Patescibacteria group bacterium]|nr:hypothetical protein [Patescibacteria group bacterium]